MLVGGMRPHYYCLPILKRRAHRDALVRLATSSHPRVFLGTDSAPHPQDRKEAECCAAGCFTAPVALSCLAEVFEAEHALDRLEGFTSLFGPAFYGLAPNSETTVLEKGAPLDPIAAVETGAGPIAVFDPGRPLHWRVIA
jgi:dihydroorotase